MVDLTKLDHVELAAKLRELPVPEWNDHRARSSDRFRGAYLRDAYLRGASEEQIELNGKHIAVGPIGGYTALVFGAKNADGHIIRAGCWTGTVDGLLGRAREEFDDDATMEMVQAVDSFIRLVLKQWRTDGGAA